MEKYTCKICILITCLILNHMQVKGQLSPGKLSKAHANLEGLSNCTKCHILGEKETTQKCLECHTEINDLIKRNKGYHASSDVRRKDCHECHGEHFGRDFNVIRFTENDFDHRLTGYDLEGSHKQITCDGCHNKEFSKTIFHKNPDIHIWG